MSTMISFTCENCLKTFKSVISSRTICRGCTPKTVEVVNCRRCNIKMVRTKTCVCAKCKTLIVDSQDTDERRQKIAKQWLTNKDVINTHRAKIMRLLTKAKWGYLTPVDHFIIADIFILITDEYDKWDRLEQSLQIEMMLMWLKELISFSDRSKIKA